MVFDWCYPFDVTCIYSFKLVCKLFLWGREHQDCKADFVCRQSCDVLKGRICVAVCLELSVITERGSRLDCPMSRR